MNTTAVRVRLHLPDVTPEHFASLRLDGFQILNYPEMPGTVVSVGVLVPAHGSETDAAGFAVAVILDADPAITDIRLRDDIQ